MKRLFFVFLLAIIASACKSMPEPKSPADDVAMNTDDSSDVQQNEAEAEEPCSNCGGTSSHPNPVPCTACGGTGQQNGSSCSSCGGTGKKMCGS